jgi:uncharacterized protein (TIGR02147 family)
MVEVIHYTSPKDFLAAVLNEKKKNNPGFSLRLWSKQLGFKNPSYLSAVIKGVRNPNLTFLRKVSINLNLSESDTRKLELLTLIQSAKSEAEKELPMALLDWMGNEHYFVSLGLDQFRLISDWYHLVIFDMVELKDFKWDPLLISRRLAGKVSPYNVERAIERLVRLKLLKRVGRKLVKVKGEPEVGDSLPSDAIRNHHKQFIEKSLEALEQQSFKQRDYCGTTLAIKLTDLEKIRAVIRKFHKEVQRFAVSNGTADEIYRFNSQLFSTTVGVL